MVLRQPLPPSATEYARAQRLENQAAVKAILRQWRRMGADFDRSWLTIAPVVAEIMATAQVRIAQRADDFIPQVLTDTGQDWAVDPIASLDTSGFAGTTGAGVDVVESLSVATIRAKQGVAEGQSVAQALLNASSWLGYSSGTILSDTKRAAERTGMLIRPTTGWIRMLTPPSCARCAILAGRRYRNNAAFDRHPGCDCTQIPAAEYMAGDLTVDPQAYFDSLDEAGQLKLAGSKSNLEAIRDGADLNQVVNAYRSTAGMRAAQASPIKTERGYKFTTEGTTRRGIAGQQQAGLRRNGPNQLRLMPESIAKRAGADVEERIRLLKLYGWIRDDVAAARGREIFATARRAERAAAARARRAASKSTSAAPKTATGGTGGGSVPPRTPAAASGAADGSSKYWKARQDALPVDFGGDTLEPHEIAFVERFLEAGHSLRWIPRDGFRPTNDFLWSSNGDLPVELKSTKAKYSTIRGRILDATSRAAKQGVDKTNFIIDLGSQPLTNGLRIDLADYNVGRRKYRIARLWVMSRGALEEIELRT